MSDEKINLSGPDLTKGIALSGIEIALATKLR